MNVRAPNQFSRRLIVGSVYGIAGMLVGLILGLIPGSGIVLMIVCGIFGAWLGSCEERDPNLSDELPR
jgi:uncharacterized membrane protein YeaQ/YmgE (transglycosylase-associated protein family)